MSYYYHPTKRLDMYYKGITVSSVDSLDNIIGDYDGQYCLVMDINDIYKWNNRWIRCKINNKYEYFYDKNTQKLWKIDYDNNNLKQYIKRDGTYIIDNVSNIVYKSKHK